MTISHATQFESWLDEIMHKFEPTFRLMGKCPRTQLTLENMRPWLELAWDAGIVTELQARQRIAQAAMSHTNGIH